MNTVERKAFDARMQVLGFENNEINAIWNAVTLENKPLQKDEYQNVMEFIKLRHNA